MSEKLKEKILKRLIILFCLLFPFIIQQTSYAGGAAVRRNPPQPQQIPPQIQQQIRERAQQRMKQQLLLQQRLRQQSLRPLKVPSQKQEEKSKPARKPQVKYPPQEVLTSTPFFKDTASSQAKASQGQPNPVKGSEQQWAQLFNRLDESSETWLQIDDTRFKMLVISRYIDVYRQRGVTIQKPPMHYTTLINSMARDNPRLLMNPFEQVLRMAAIMEYDFNNGQNKEDLVRSLLAPQAYKENKRRLGLE